MVELESVFPTFYCECFPHMKGRNHYNVAVALIFRQCFYSNEDVVSYVIGWLSILTSMISLFPQIIKNFTLKSSAGLSIYVFIIWMIGDVTNLVGCILTNQLATQIYLAAYYVAMDIIIITQYAWYEFKIEKVRPFISRIRNWKKPKESSSNNATSSSSLTNSGTDSTQKTILPSHLFPNLLGLVLVFLILINGEIIQGEEVPNCISTTDPPQELYIFGIVCSYISCLCYIIALAPQVYKNYKRKCVKGLSLLMFLIDELTQILYIVSIIIAYSQENAHFDAITGVPYILGSVTTFGFSFIIAVQFWFYKRKSANTSTTKPKTIEPTKRKK